MEVRRAKIMEAQLVSRGHSQEAARLAVSQGPEAIATLMASQPSLSSTSVSSGASSTAGGVAVQTSPEARTGYSSSSCGTNTSPLGPAAVAPPVVDISWAFPASSSSRPAAALAPTTSSASSSAAGTLPAVDTSWMFGRATHSNSSGGATGASAAPLGAAANVVSIEWMFENPTLGDEDMAREAGQAYASAEGIAVEAFECQCCFEEIPEMTGLQMSPGPQGCDHVLCPECFKRMISGQIEKKEACTCPLCPATNPSQVPIWLVSRVLGRDMASQLSRIEQIHLGQADGGQLRLWQCPTPDCTNRQIVDPDWDPEQVALGERIVDCGCCKKRICVRCNVEEHAGFTCDQFKEWRRANDSAEQSYAMMIRDGLIKPCPNCAAPILKTEGCNFMTCPTCNDPNRMCWQTGKKRYGPDGCGGGHNCH